MVKYLTKKLRKISKREERSKVNRPLYNLSFCNGITNKSKLLTKLNNLKDIINITTKKTKPLLINIVPYCGEKVKLSKYIEKENDSSIDLDLVKSIESTFNAKIISNFINSGITKTTSQYVSFPDSQKFRDLLENKDTLNMILNGKKHALLVVHSKFMKELTELYGNKTKFANLDIIHIIISKDNMHEPLLYIRKFINYYGNPSPINTDIPYKKSLLTGNTNVFLMRHCVACHNIIEKVGNSILLAKVIKKLKGELGFSLYSICSPYTINELIDKKHSLLELFNTTCGSIDNIQFGSSVILRAILTSILVSTILKLT
jgi:hypothetical protein